MQNFPTNFIKFKLEIINLRNRYRLEMYFQVSLKHCDDYVFVDTFLYLLRCIIKLS